MTPHTRSPQQSPRDGLSEHPTFTVIAGSESLRTLVCCLIGIHWPGAQIAEVDPFSQTIFGAGFALGKKSDAIILGGIGSESEGLAALARLRVRDEKMVCVMLINSDLEYAEPAFLHAGATAVLRKDMLSGNALMRSIKERRDDVPLAKPDVRASRFHFTHDGERNAMVIPGLRYVASLNANPDSHVFAAERLTDGRRVVVKVPTQSPYYESAQLHQIGARWQFLAKLDTRYVVRYLDAGIAGAWIFGVMEYLSGGDLRARIRAGLNGVQSVRLLFRLASALESIHRHGYAHMDIKPENIFFRESITSTTGSEEARNAPVLIDFNLSTRFGEVVKHPVSQDILGTPLYMSPEQAQGLPIAATSDLYSLGVVFFEMLSGETPFPVESATQTMFRHIYDEIPLLPKRVREYQPLIDRLLAKDPRERFQSGAELASALSPLLMESAS